MNRKELFDAIKLASTCAVGNKLIPMFENLSFKKDSIQSFNGEQGISVPFKSDMDFAINSNLLTKLVDSYNTETIDFSKESEDLANLVCGKSKNKLPIYPNSDFISPFTKIKGETTISLTDDLVNGLKKCLTSINKNSPKEAQTGITLKKNKKDLVLYSTDNLRISKYEVKDKVIEDGNLEVLLPEKFCKMVTSLYDKDTTSELNFTKSTVSASLGNCDIFTNVNNKVKLYDFEEVLENIFPKEVEYQNIPKEFIESINRTEIVLGKDLNRKANIVSNGKNLTISASSSNCSINEEIELASKITMSDFDIDSDLLNQSLSEITEFDIRNTNKGFVIVGRDDNFTTIIAGV